MSSLDPFTQRRLLAFIETHRARTGQLPTLQDFEDARFPREAIGEAIKRQLIEKFYVTLTSGTVVKGYKIKGDLRP